MLLFLAVCVFVCVSLRIGGFLLGGGGGGVALWEGGGVVSCCVVSLCRNEEVIEAADWVWVRILAGFCICVFVVWCLCSVVFYDAVLCWAFNVKLAGASRRAWWEWRWYSRETGFVQDKKAKEGTCVGS